MVSDSEGFLFPEVDHKRCADCGLCRDACPMLHVEDVDHSAPQKVYACWNSNEAVRLQSSSGGAFSALAGRVLDEGGVVFGAGFDDGMKVRHIAVRKKEELGRLRGSKYVQSDIGSAYMEVKKLLEQKRRVLFSGTPCQVAGLHAAVDKENKNLVTCDLLCKGVPSPGLFAKYVACLQRRFRAELIAIDFRSKCRGWGIQTTIASFSNGRQHVLRDSNNSFYYGFAQNLTLRRSCYRCPYASIKRRGDITLGDFWSIGERGPFDHDTRSGVSIVVVNSEKGDRMLDESTSNLRLEERMMEEAQDMRALSHPWQEPKSRNQFSHDYQRLEYDELTKKYLVDNGLKRLIKLIVPPTWIFRVRRSIGRARKQCRNS